MSKELEALNDLRNCGLVKDDVVCFTKKAFEKRLDIIESTLKDFEWLKSKLDIDFMNRLSVPEDKIRLLKIMGLEIEFNE